MLEIQLVNKPNSFDCVDNLLPNITTGFHVNHGDDFFVPCATPWSDAKISITLELSQVAVSNKYTLQLRKECLER